MNEFGEWDTDYIEAHKVADGDNRKDHAEIYCPECGAKNFKINFKTGEYDGFSCDCMSDPDSRKKIAKILRPFTEEQKRRFAEENGYHHTPRTVDPAPEYQAKNKKMEVQYHAPLDKFPNVIELRKSRAESPAIINDPIQWGRSEYKGVKASIASQAEKDNAGVRSIREIRYPYNNEKFVSRFEWTNELSERKSAIERRERGKQYSKTIRQAHLTLTGITQWKDDGTAWNPYRINDLLEASEGNAILVVEGESTCDTAYKYGLAAITIRGNNWSNSTQLDPLFEAIDPSCLIIFLADNDTPGKEKGEKFIQECWKRDRPAVAISMGDVAIVPKTSGDLVDCYEGGMKWDQIEKRIKGCVIKAAKKLKEESEKEDKKQKTEQVIFESMEVDKKPTKMQKVVRAVEEWLDGRSLRLNEMTKEIEVGGEPIDLDKIFVEVSLMQNISCINLEKFVTVKAKENSYSPVRTYLQKCHEEHGMSDRIDLNNLAKRYFNNDDPIANIMVKKWMIGAVKRGLAKGKELVKFDNALILKGKPNLGKSTFFKEFFSAEWFTDSVESVEGKDGLMDLHGTWGCELPEIENTFSRSSISKMKAFLSAEKDRFRTPYGRKVESFPRRFVVGGTTNLDQILRDPTGNRRYWIVNVDQVNSDLLKEEREELHGILVQASLDGESQFLSHEEYLKQEDVSSQYREIDPWESFVLNHVQYLDRVQVPEILTAIGLSLDRQTTKEHRRVCAILTSHGWEAKRRYIDGVRQTFYEPPSNIQVVEEQENTDEWQPTEEQLSQYENNSYENHPFDPPESPAIQEQVEIIEHDNQETTQSLVGLKIEYFDILGDEMRVSQIIQENGQKVTLQNGRILWKEDLDNWVFIN